MAGEEQRPVNLVGGDVQHRRGKSAFHRDRIDCGVIGVCALIIDFMRFNTGHTCPAPERLWSGLSRVMDPSTMPFPSVSYG